MPSAVPTINNLRCYLKAQYKNAKRAWKILGSPEPGPHTTEAETKAINNMSYAFLAWDIIATAQKRLKRVETQPVSQHAADRQILWKWIRFQFDQDHACVLTPKAANLLADVCYQFTQ